jgi:hypothetical protein
MQALSARRRRAGLLSLTAAMVVGMFTVAVPAAEAATTPIAADTFDRTVAGSLSSAQVGGAYTAFPSANAGKLSVSGGAAQITGLSPGQAVGAALMQTSALDTSIQSSLILPTIGDLYYAVEARRQSDGSAYRGRVRVTAAGALSLSFSRTSGSAETLLGKQDLTQTLKAGQKLWLQFEVSGSGSVQLRSRVWIDGAAQPNWQYVLTNSSGLSSRGSVGFWSYVSSSGAALSFKVADLSANSLDATTPPATAPPATTPAAATAKPNASNTGVPAGTTLTNYTGPLTITTDGTVIDSKAVYGDLKIQARNVIIRNSYLHCGSNVPGGNTGCVDANSANVYNLLITNNTIKPDHPSYYRDGIVGHEFTARKNHITRSNDGIGIFNRPGGSVNANVTVEGNYIHDLTRWSNDPAHADGTHNDGIEVQGGTNISIKGNTVVASIVAGNSLNQYGTHGGAALIVVQNVTKVANLVVSGNWFDDGQNSVCIQNAKFSTVALTLTGNLFGHNQYDFGGGSKYAIRIYSRAASSITGLAANRWENNNVLMTEGRDTGIRYNS